MTTKAQLEERIAALEAELIARGREIEQLRIRVAMEIGPESYVDQRGLRWKRYTTREGLSCYIIGDGLNILGKPINPTPTRQMPLGFARAREEAMRTGRAIRVAA